MSSCGEGAEWVEQLRAPRQSHCTSQSQPVKATLLRRAVTLCATIPRQLRRQNELIWYYLVHDNFFVSGLDWGTIMNFNPYIGLRQDEGNETDKETTHCNDITVDDGKD